jgi:hypothetical protein
LIHAEEKKGMAKAIPFKLLLISGERTLGSLFPGSQILDLFFREFVNLDLHRFQLEASDLTIQFLRDCIDALL